MMSQSTTEQDHIERGLERTRARMDNRLTELQARLSPGQVLDDLMDYFRGSEGADFTRNLMDSVRNNPLPAALTGIGLTWLMASNPHPRHDAAGDDKVASSAPTGNRAMPVIVDLESAETGERAETASEEQTFLTPPEQPFQRS